MFGLAVPSHVPGVPATVLTPRATWSDPGAYDATAKKLADLFRKNFQQFEARVPAAVREAGPLA